LKRFFKFLVLSVIKAVISREFLEIRKGAASRKMAAAILENASSF
jgi:hypothetical protein